MKGVLIESDLGGSYLLVVHVSNVWKHCLLCIDETKLVTVV